MAVAKDARLCTRAVRSSRLIGAAGLPPRRRAPPAYNRRACGSHARIWTLSDLALAEIHRARAAEGPEMAPPPAARPAGASGGGRDRICGRRALADGARRADGVPGGSDLGARPAPLSVRAGHHSARGLGAAVRVGHAAGGCGGTPVGALSAREPVHCRVSGQHLPLRAPEERRAPCPRT